MRTPNVLPNAQVRAREQADRASQLWQQIRLHLGDRPGERLDPIRLLDSESVVALIEAILKVESKISDNEYKEMVALRAAMQAGFTKVTKQMREQRDLLKELVEAGSSTSLVQRSKKALLKPYARKVLLSGHDET